MAEEAEVARKQTLSYSDGTLGSELVERKAKMWPFLLSPFQLPSFDFSAPLQVTF